MSPSASAKISPRRKYSSIFSSGSSTTSMRRRRISARSSYMPALRYSRSNAASASGSFGAIGEQLIHRLAIWAGQLDELDLVDRMQLAELGDRFVERLEHGADLRLQVPCVEHVLERDERLFVRGVRGQELAIHLDRPLAI